MSAWAGTFGCIHHTRVCARLDIEQEREEVPTMLKSGGSVVLGNGVKESAVGQDQYALLADRIARGVCRVGIIGLGYVGLPLARAFATKGFPVLGFDVDAAKVAKLQRGESYIGHITADTIREMREKRFEATSDFGRLAEADAVIICVPTPLTAAREPDLTYIVNSAQAIAAALRPGQLIVLERSEER